MFTPKNLYIIGKGKTSALLNWKDCSGRFISFLVVPGRFDIKQPSFLVVSGCLDTTRNEVVSFRISENRDLTKVISTISAPVQYSDPYCSLFFYLPSQFLGKFTFFVKSIFSRHAIWAWWKRQPWDVDRRPSTTELDWGFQLVDVDHWAILLVDVDHSDVFLVVDVTLFSLGQ